VDTNLRTPSTHSSIKVKDRVCRPSPHISNLSVEVWAFLQKAAGAFSRPPVWKKKIATENNCLRNQEKVIAIFQGNKKVCPFPYRRWRPTFPCSEGAIYVVETANAALDAKVLGVVLAQLLGCKLLQSISILRLKGKQLKQI
jgi:hypothetical protein